MRRPAFIAIPHDFPGFEFDTTKVSIRLISAAESVEKAVVKNRGGPMNFQRRAAPYFIHSTAVGLYPEEDGTDFVIGSGQEDEVIHDDWIHRVDRIVSGR